MTEDQIVGYLILLFGASFAVYAAAVYMTTARVDRIFYLAITMGGGALVHGFPDENVTSLFIVSLVAVAAHGFAVGGRLNDAGMSKLHAIWAWVPILFIGLAFPKPLPVQASEPQHLLGQA